MKKAATTKKIKPLSNPTPGKGQLYKSLSKTATPDDYDPCSTDMVCVTFDLHTKNAPLTGIVAEFSDDPDFKGKTRITFSRTTAPSAKRAKK